MLDDSPAAWPRASAAFVGRSSGQGEAAQLEERSKQRSVRCKVSEPVLSSAVPHLHQDGNHSVSTKLVLTMYSFS